MCVVAQAAPDDRARAGSLLPSTWLTGFAPGPGIFAHGLGFGQMIRMEDFRTVAFCLLAGFVPRALLGCLTVKSFGHRTRMCTAS